MFKLNNSKMCRKSLLDANSMVIKCVCVAEWMRAGAV